MAVCEKQLVRFGPFELNSQTSELSKLGRKLKLQGQPIQVLQLLLTKPGELVTRDEIREHLWPADTFVDFEHSLNTAVKKLRQALGDEADTPRYIETLPRRGYRFIATVEANHEAEIPEPGPLAVVDSPPPPPVRKRPTLRHFSYIAAAALLLFAAIAFVTWLRNRNTGKVESIAVLPLANFSGDPEQDYFADGITEELISDLSQIKALRVISRTSVMRYKGAKKTLTEIGKELGVDAIVEGSVQRSGDRVRIAAQLVKTDSERHLWAETYERDLKDVLSLRNEVARAIADEIRIEITPQERTLLGQSQSVVPEAYLAYLKGRHAADRISIDGLLKSAEYYEDAVRLDPNFAKAWAALGHTYFLVGFQSELPPSSRCIPAMKRAMQLDPNLAEAHVNYADLKFHRDWKWVEGLAEFRHAAQLDPRSIDARQHYALALWQLGIFDKAIEEMQSTLALDPLSPGLNFGMAGLYRDAHQDEKALRLYLRTLELEPNSGPVHLGLATFYEELGRPQEAIAEYTKWLELGESDQQRKQELSKALQSGGTHAYWLKVLNNTQQDSQKHHVPPMDFASLYSHLGDRQNALKWLELSYAQRSPRLSWIKVQTAWDPLRSEPRFQQLVRELNFPNQAATEVSVPLDHSEL